MHHISARMQQVSQPFFALGIIQLTQNLQFSSEQFDETIQTALENLQDLTL